MCATRPRGRPRNPNRRANRLSFCLGDDELARLDAWRAGRNPPLSRAEACRRAVLRMVGRAAT
jgi:hypothetical protein